MNSYSAPANFLLRAYDGVVASPSSVLEMSSHGTPIFGEDNSGLQVGTNTGAIDVHFHLSHPESAAHVGSAAIPFRRNDVFVPRGDLLDRIDGICSRPSGRVALIGFGGVGLG